MDNAVSKSTLHTDPRFVDARPANGRKVHTFTLGVRFRRKNSYVKALCGSRISGDIVPITFESGNDYCSTCEVRVANAMRRVDGARR